jgi:mono/diheme cytochrome c family protein
MRRRNPRAAPRALALAAALAAVPLAGCPSLDPMWRQPKQKAYDAGPTGGGMRTPPAGTVAYRSLLEPAVATGLAPDGTALRTAPLPPTAELLAKGRARFEVYCAVCHGVLGDGESQLALNMSLRKPPSLHDYRDVADGRIFQVITEGFGLMASYAAELTVEERWAVVAYVRALQLSQAASLEQVPPEARGELEGGTR